MKTSRAGNHFFLFVFLSSCALASFLSQLYDISPSPCFQCQPGIVDSLIAHRQDSMISPRDDNFTNVLANWKITQKRILNLNFLFYTQQFISYSFDFWFHIRFYKMTNDRYAREFFYIVDSTQGRSVISLLFINRYLIKDRYLVFFTDKVYLVFDNWSQKIWFCLEHLEH